jgi:hypothetical protein
MINNYSIGYSLNDLYNKHIIIRILNKKDLCDFIEISNYNNTVRTFNAEKVWNKYVEPLNNCNKIICIELEVNDEEDNYDFMFTFGSISYYTDPILHRENKYEIVDYHKDIINNWEI